MPLGEVAANLRAAKELVFLPPLKNAKDFHIGGRTNHLPGKKSFALSLTSFGVAWLKGAICNIISLLDVAVFTRPWQHLLQRHWRNRRQNRTISVLCQVRSFPAWHILLFFFCGKLHSLLPFYHFPLLLLLWASRGICSMLTDVYMVYRRRGRWRRRRNREAGLWLWRQGGRGDSHGAQRVNNQQGTKYTWGGAITSLPTLDVMTPPGLYMAKSVLSLKI